MTEEKQSTATDISRALEVLRRGGVILYPTDTVWGIGCDATNAEAIRRIYGIKRRPDTKALITLVATEVMLERTVDTIPEVAWQLLEAAVEPLTVVYDHATGVDPSLLAPDGSVGVRLVREGFAHELCKRLGRPLVSTSANLAGAPTPLCFAEIAPEITGAVDYVCESHRHDAPAKRASGVIKLGCDGTVKILR